MHLQADHDLPVAGGALDQIAVALARRVLHHHPHAALALRRLVLSHIPHRLAKPRLRRWTPAAQASTFFTIPG